ncbi:aminotransferase class I/II-fold pyridoxal phosphate-dependent enzyme [Dethiosulfatarculus sandiegensis]|uniref:O-acetyl-L-homoserine sulfhydrolase n=1 Tax=Dethiosulfatarculus sandiegensis TaxID=1429043 RepID=A0A0D2HUW9_9BACT|nr:aminotransferase class I/II-fold pyridoxal phosphate-dependent enzyme [Dethiosulfatarculus sandiegensis]KIX14213.1 O-acetyl-L-homoserine sulfhydrolase [Dethiosulfatarculus sandiegensis]
MSNSRFETKAIHGSNPQKWRQILYYDHTENSGAKGSSSEPEAGRPRPDYAPPGPQHPENRFLNERLTLLENGRGALLTSSGMAAINNVCLTLLRTGDEFIASNSLFRATYLLFDHVFAKYGLKVRLVDPTHLKAMEKAITPKTRFIYLESISTPRLEVPDIKKAASLAHDHDLPLVVDNTLASPYLCRPIELGADLVINFTNAYLSGHDQALGGVVIDKGSFPWAAGARFPDFQDFVDQSGKLAFLAKMQREQHLNTGSAQSFWHARLTSLGLETLNLRMERHLSNAVKLAGHLTKSPKVHWVNYPGLPQNPYHKAAKETFGGRGYGALLSIGLKDAKSCESFLSNLKMIGFPASPGQSSTLATHPWSMDYADFDPETKALLGIKPEMIMITVGLEAIEDIKQDVRQALKKVAK